MLAVGKPGRARVSIGRYRLLQRMILNRTGLRHRALPEQLKMGRGVLRSGWKGEDEI